MRPFVLLALTLLLAACGEQAKAPPPQPAAYDPAATAEFCGMAVGEHPGPKGQVMVSSRDKPFWFASARELLVFLRLAESPKDIVAVYLTDMGKAADWEHPATGGWIDARKAVYVIGADIKGAMGQPEAVPFADKAAADKFVAAHGGKVVGFDAMPEDFLFPPVDKLPATGGRT